jgi:hypothetical protein
MSTSQHPPLAPAGYDPIGPLRSDQRVGRLIVRGNDSWAIVLRPGIFPVPIRDEDNGNGCPPGQSASAFERCKAWAEANQDKAGPVGLFG